MTGPLLGWDKTTTFAVVIPVILFYVLLSGYMGVVVSDLIQSLVMIAGSFALMYFVLADFGGEAGVFAGPGNLYNALVEKFGEEVVSWHPPSSHVTLGLIGVIAWTVGTAALGMIMVASGTISFSCLYIARWNVAGIFAALCAVSGVLFLPAYRSYMTYLGVDNDGSQTPEGDAD